MNAAAQIHHLVPEVRPREVVWPLMGCAPVRRGGAGLMSTLRDDDLAPEHSALDRGPRAAPSDPALGAILLAEQREQIVMAQLRLQGRDIDAARELGRHVDAQGELPAGLVEQFGIVGAGVGPSRSIINIKAEV